jgi:DNA-binding LacI/PurR family transcriptional regulator/DNA-binding transcriptional regulator YhcF (GntR family)
MIPTKQTITPTVHRIALMLEARIRSGEYEEDAWLPTERDLAEEFHVSRATIRLALGALEKRNLLYRAAGCRPLVRNGSGAKPGGTDTTRLSLGLWMSGDPTDVGGAMTALGIHRVLDPDAYRLVVANHRGATLDALIESEAQVLARFARDSDIAGLILWYFGGDRNLSALEALRAAKIPMVFVDRRSPRGFEADYVGVDNERAAREVVKHLLQQGHRHIAHITNTEPASTVAERQAGYRRALEEASIALRPELTLIIPFMELEGTDRRRQEAALVGRLLALPGPPTAVFTVNDATALHLIAGLRERGVRVPEDIAVAGFDDEEQCRPGAPFLTTTISPSSRWARKPPASCSNGCRPARPAPAVMSCWMRRWCCAHPRRPGRCSARKRHIQPGVADRLQVRLLVSRPGAKTPARNPILPISHTARRQNHADQKPEQRLYTH